MIHLTNDVTDLACMAFEQMNADIIVVIQKHSSHCDDNGICMPLSLLLQPYSKTRQVLNGYI